MDELLEKLNKRYDDRFADLKLFDVVYDRNAACCTFCFLFPMTKDNVSAEDRQAILDFVKEFFCLSCEVKIKFKKSFLDQPLVKKEITNFFENNHKALAPYISEDNISSQNSGLDVSVQIAMNEDILSMIDENSVRQKLIGYLNKKFIANFEVAFKESQEKLPDEIDIEDLLPEARRTIPRYEVMVIKKVFGGEITPKPEYIKNVTSPKTSVIFAGKASNFVKKSFVIKKGKRQGEEKSYYSFNLQDNSGSIECIYFCPKSHEKQMDSLCENADMIMLLFVGNVQKGLSDRLTYYIKKMAVCQPVAQTRQNIDVPQDADSLLKNHKRVVTIEPIEALSQDTIFGEVAEYNDTIMNNNIVVFDIETTGLDSENCEITEIGAVKIIGGKIKERFSSFVKTQHPIPEEVTRLTHITNEMITDAPSVEDVIVDFYEYTRGCIISGYNIVDFDMKFIKKAASKIGLKFDNVLLDAFIIARQASLRAPNYKLGTVVKVLGLTLADAHRAYNDAQATAMVLLKLSRLKK